MIEKWRKLLAGGAGYIVAGVIVLLAIGLTIYSVRANFGPTDAVAYTQKRMVVCSKTGKSFEVKLEPGMTFPVKSPYSGENTGYLAEEVCNWTEGGQVGSTTTYLLMNKTRGKSGPTFCPTCHRLVVRNNPMARADLKPPPTEAEYLAKKSGHVEETAQRNSD